MDLEDNISHIFEMDKTFPFQVGDLLLLKDKCSGLAIQRDKTIQLTPNTYCLLVRANYVDQRLGKYPYFNVYCLKTQEICRLWVEDWYKFEKLLPEEPTRTYPTPTKVK